jgi:hypothetical protein
MIKDKRDADALNRFSLYSQCPSSSSSDVSLFAGESGTNGAFSESLISGVTRIIGIV